MSSGNTMKRLFNLTLVYLKTEDHESKQILKSEIDLLHQEFKNDDKISNDIKKGFEEILKQYKIIYESELLSERYQAEDRVKELIQKLRNISS